MEYEKRILEERCQQNSSEQNDEERLKSLKEELADLDKKMASLAVQEQDYQKQIKQLKDELEMQRKEGTGSANKKEDFYFKKVKELKTQKEDIEKQILN